MNFFNILETLCTKNNTSVTAVLKKLGYSTSKGTAWRNGSIPTGDILLNLAEYFNVSVDYLLGRMDYVNPHKSQIERSDILMGKYLFRANVDELFNVVLNNSEVKKFTNEQLNYGWKLIALEEEKGQRFIVLEWQKEGKPDIDPFEGGRIYSSSVAVAAARSSDDSLPVKPNVDNLDDFPTMDEE